jgi:hypothetical protein
MAGPSGASGTTIHIGTTAVNLQTDAFQLIGSLENLSEFGPSFADITFEDLGTGLVAHFKGARDDGVLNVGLGRDIDNVGQVAVRAALLSKDDFNFKVAYNDAAPAVSGLVTISVASPGVVSFPNHNLTVDTPVKLTTTGSLPTGLTPDTTVFVKTVIDTSSLTLALTKGGAAINTTGTQTGVHTLTTVPAPTIEFFKAKVNSFKTNVGNLQSVVKATVGLGIRAGSLVTVPRLPAVVA